MTHEPSGQDHEATPAPGDAQPGRIRILLLVIVIVAVGFVVVRFVKKDVVTQWEVLASCSSATDIGPARVSSTLDTSACLAQPDDPGHTRGWPIVTFVLPPEVGPDPDISGITSDGTTRTMSITYEGAPAFRGHPDRRARAGLRRDPARRRAARALHHQGRCRLNDRDERAAAAVTGGV